MLVDLNRLNIAYDTAFQSSISHQIMSGKKARHTGSDCLWVCWWRHCTQIIAHRKRLSSTKNFLHCRHFPPVATFIAQDRQYTCKSILMIWALTYKPFRGGWMNQASDETEQSRFFVARWLDLAAAGECSVVRFLVVTYNAFLSVRLLSSQFTRFGHVWILRQIIQTDLVCSDIIPLTNNFVRQLRESCVRTVASNTWLVCTPSMGWSACNDTDRSLSQARVEET